MTKTRKNVWTGPAIEHTPPADWDQCDLPEGFEWGTTYYTPVQTPTKRLAQNQGWNISFPPNPVDEDGAGLWVTVAPDGDPDKYDGNTWTFVPYQSIVQRSDIPKAKQLLTLERVVLAVAREEAEKGPTMFTRQLMLLLGELEEEVVENV